MASNSFLALPNRERQSKSLMYCQGIISKRNFRSFSFFRLILLIVFMFTPVVLAISRYERPNFKHRIVCGSRFNFILHFFSGVLEISENILLHLLHLYFLIEFFVL